MPQSPSVLVAVGAHEAPKVPNQKYKNIFTEYNIQQITKHVIIKPKIMRLIVFELTIASSLYKKFHPK